MHRISGTPRARAARHGVEVGAEELLADAERVGGAVDRLEPLREELLASRGDAQRRGGGVDRRHQGGGVAQLLEGAPQRLRRAPLQVLVVAGQRDHQVGVGGERPVELAAHVVRRGAGPREVRHHHLAVGCEVPQAGGELGNEAGGSVGYAGHGGGAERDDAEAALGAGAQRHGLSGAEAEAARAELEGEGQRHAEGDGDQRAAEQGARSILWHIRTPPDRDGSR